MASQQGLESEPLFRIGQALTGAVDRAAAQAVLLLDGWLADPERFLMLLAAIGLACAAMVWLLAMVFSWMHRAPRPAPAAAPTSS